MTPRIQCGVWGRGSRQSSSRWALTHHPTPARHTPEADDEKQPLQVSPYTSALVLFNTSECAFAEFLLHAPTLCQIQRYSQAVTCRIIYTKLKALFVALSVIQGSGGSWPELSSPQFKSGIVSQTFWPHRHPPPHTEAFNITTWISVRERWISSKFPEWS